MMILEMMPRSNGKTVKSEIKLFNRTFTVVGRDFTKEEEFKRCSEFYLESLEHDLLEKMPNYLGFLTPSADVSHAENLLLWGSWERAKDWMMFSCGVSEGMAEMIIEGAKLAPFTLFFDCTCEVQTELEKTLPLECDCCRMPLKDGGHECEDKPPHQLSSGRICSECAEV